MTDSPAGFKNFFKVIFQLDSPIFGKCHKKSANRKMGLNRKLFPTLTAPPGQNLTTSPFLRPFQKTMLSLSFFSFRPIGA